MSTELDRLSQASRRQALFWLLVTLVLLAYCLYGAFTNDPTLIRSWRGAALLLLSAGYCVWYTTWTAKHFFRKGHAIIIGAMRPPWHKAFAIWGSVFATLCVMAALSPMMGWMFWASFGMALGMFEFPLALLPAALSVLGVFYSLIVTDQPPLDALLWIVISMGLGMLSVGYTIYTANRLTGERVQREQVFSDLEDAHRQLADAHRQLELSAERDAELAVLSERSRLAREMHDTIGHALVLIAVKLEAAQRLRAVNPERADHEIDVTKEIVRSTMSEMRASLANLRSPITAQQSIGEMLARRARESGEHAGFHITYQVQPDLGELRASAQEALYRIGAEALTNIEKHAHAQNVTLSLARCDDLLTLQIEDDGVGLPALVTTGTRAAGAPSTQPASPAGHYGITGMRERAEALGGRLSVRPRPGGGTLVEARLPTISSEAETLAGSMQAGERA